MSNPQEVSAGNELIHDAKSLGKFIYLPPSFSLEELNYQKPKVTPSEPKVTPSEPNTIKNIKARAVKNIGKLGKIGVAGTVANIAYKTHERVSKDKEDIEWQKTQAEIDEFEKRNRYNLEKDEYYKKVAELKLYQDEKNYLSKLKKPVDPFAPPEEKEATEDVATKAARQAKEFREKKEYEFKKKQYETMPLPKRIFAEKPLSPKSSKKASSPKSPRKPKTFVEEFPKVAAEEISSQVETIGDLLKSGTTALRGIEFKKRQKKFLKNQGTDPLPVNAEVQTVNAEVQNVNAEVQTANAEVQTVKELETSKYASWIPTIDTYMPETTGGKVAAGAGLVAGVALGGLLAKKYIDKRRARSLTPPRRLFRT
jgi:hypothetical protein